MSKPCCSLGAHPRASDIAAALREGQSVRDVARAYGVGKSSVSEHRKHLGLDTADASADRGGHAADEGNGMGEVKNEPTLTPLTRARDPSARNATDLQDKSYQAHVYELVPLIASGQYEGGRDVPLFEKKWAIGANAVRARVKAAAAVVHANRGDIEQIRTEAVSSWTRIRDTALATADTKGAAMAQRGLDMATGVTQPGGNVVINVLQDPMVARILERVKECLLSHPEALADVTTGLQALKAENVGVKALGGKR
jgi:transposase-like protein